MISGFTQPDTALLTDLKRIVGEKGWKPGAEPSPLYDDPRGRFEGQGSVILSPASTREVADIVALCNAAGIGIIPVSGGTGVVAGQLSIHSDKAVILSLARMNRVREVAVDDGVIVVEAGCILETIHNAAQEHGMTFPLSMASKGSCCIGGNLATNAGGIQVVRHGNARDLCLGIEAVLPDGSLYSDLSPLRKDNTGYDLRNLLIGSEGTLGVITAATLILKPQDAQTSTLLCAVPSPAGALSVYKALRGPLGDSISALELMSGFGLDLVTTHFPDLKSPFPERHDWYLLIEAGGPVGIGARVEDALAACFERDLVIDAVIAQSEAQRANLWALRENTPAANRAGGAFCSSDTAVPVSKVHAFIDRTCAGLAAIDPALRINTYGHIGDGNIHHNILPPEGISKAGYLSARPGISENVRMAINEATHHCAGSISAEHGIGRLKTHDMALYCAPAKLAALKQIKAALDPKGIMNPGALLSL